MHGCKKINTKTCFIHTKIYNKTTTDLYRTFFLLFFVAVFWVFTSLGDSIFSGVDEMVSGSPSKRGLMMTLGEAKLGAREKSCWKRTSD